MPPTDDAIDQSTDDATTDSPDTDQAAGDDTGEVETTDQETSQQTDEAAGATDDTASDDAPTELISQERFDALKDDPAALRKELNKAATKKFQQLAAERKALGPWAQIKDAFAADHVAGLQQLASQFGLEVRDPKAVADAAAATDAGDEAVAELKAALAEVGLEEVADKLAPVIRKIAESAAGKTTEPLRKHQEKLVEESTKREAEAMMAAFAKTHPEWKPGNAVDKKMAQLAKKFQPAVDDKGQPTMSEAEYLDHLFDLATKEDSVKRLVAEAIDRMTKGALAAEDKTPGVSGNRVAKTPPPNATFDDAAAAAAAGVRWSG